MAIRRLTLSGNPLGNFPQTEAAAGHALREYRGQLQWETGETIEEQEFSLVDVRAAVFFENNDEDGAVILRHTLTTNRLTKNRLRILATRACKRGYVACLRLLLNARANPNFKPKDLEQEQSLLHHAAYNGHVECVKILLTGEPPGRGEPADLLFRNKFNEDAVDAANARLRKVNGAIRRGFDDDDDNDQRLAKRLQRCVDILNEGVAEHNFALAEHEVD